MKGFQSFLVSTKNVLLSVTGGNCRCTLYLAEPPTRFELATSGLQNRCSTTELQRHHNGIDWWYFFVYHHIFPGLRIAKNTTVQITITIMDIYTNRNILFRYKSNVTLDMLPFNIRSDFKIHNLLGGMI